MNCRTLVFYFMLLACLVSANCDEQLQLELVNSADAQLDDRLVAIPRSVFQLAEENALPLLHKADGTVLTTQVEDLDQDHKWDVMLLQVSLEAGEKAVIFYEETAAGTYPKFESKTNVYLGLSPKRNNQFREVKQHQRPSDHIAQSKPFLYQYEGPGWESELIAFRSYFDSRNGKDIFGKTRRQLITREIGLSENYHELQDWGMDILKVGSSLGAGAIGMKKGDSLF
ncbi:MAG: DUF4861 family protein, partial [Bacteroidota bacterium]